MQPATYRDPDWLRQHVRDVLSFYYPSCVDTHYGGYVAQLDEQDGHVYDGQTKHLVATARAVHNFSVGVMLDGPVWCRPAAEHGLTFLESAHWDPDNEGYDWRLEGRETVDATRHCYGHGFVMLAGARAHQAGLRRGKETLERAYDVIDERFWEEDYGLCADEASGDWSELSPYRGLNANMHTCEALLAAYEATGEARYIDRAGVIASTVTRDLAEDHSGRIWEHFTEDWAPDKAYNRDEPAHQFRPWGYQPGHHAEWAKLLLVLHEHAPADWHVERAAELFDVAVDLGWDDEHGGFYYTVDGDGEPVVDDKYSWELTEAIGAAALLAQHDADYAAWYDRLWEHSMTHFVNPRHGNWYERLTRSHERDDPNRGVAVEPGYHPLNNAWVAMQAFAE
ncbi:AGE family epimerase/isomerase [Halomicroarcula sp. GCM10025324]|uniref:AGE family epimerase/isomerase n=1 Tax=Haloarcula TaxID=2237 RepID=UPI0023E7826A|nr:AGE family epimerase/isomerase [Halomicroarcula sp. ZS-22-S1]